MSPGSDLRTMKGTRLILTVSVMAIALACSKDKDNYLEEETVELLEKIYHDGALYQHLFYNDQQVIERIVQYRNGAVYRQVDIKLDEQGRVTDVLSDFGHYTSHRTLTYAGDRKVADLTTNLLQDGSQPTYFKRTWTYPGELVIQDNMYKDDLETLNITTACTFDASGNIIRRERHEVIANRKQSMEYLYDDHLSPEHMIESTIPGYHEMPQAKHQSRHQKIYDRSGELTLEVHYLNEYSSSGKLVRSIESSDNGSREYGYEYKVVKVARGQ